MSKERTPYLDYLRVFAIFAVIILHTASQNWSSVSVGSAEHIWFNLYNSIVRWCVPVFVMISGSLFLNKEDIPYKTLFSKYILRLIIAFFVWNIIYAVYTGGGIGALIANTVAGHYHMWFIPMIIGLYLCLPILKKITSSSETTKYFIVLAIIISTIVPTITALVADFAPAVINNGFQGIIYDIDNLNLSVVTGYPLYFVLGYQLSKTDLSKKYRTIIIMLGILGFILTIVLNYLVSVKCGQISSNYLDYFSIGVFLESIGVFTFGKYNLNKIKSSNKAFAMLAKYTFGAYLVHALILDILNKYLNFGTTSLYAGISVPIIGIIVIIVSFVISAILNNIPIIKKYLV